jgi:hypothetical protein
MQTKHAAAAPSRCCGIQINGGIGLAVQGANRKSGEREHRRHPLFVGLVMSELKLVLGSDGEPEVAAPKPDLSSLNPIDALNRRDIELIKKSLAGMHKDGAELRNAIVALHTRNSRAPSRSFFISLGVVAFIAVGTLAAARPTLDEALQHVPMLAKLTPSDVPR